MSDIDKLLDVMARLRNPDGGCPWDVEQSFATIAPYTIEEAYEVADAIERDDMADLRDELGDLLFQVVFHARMAEEDGHFDFADVVTNVTDKLVRRHPHVFGTQEEIDAGQVRGAWEQIKAAERAAAARDDEHSALDGVAKALPALMRAQKIGKRASRVGFDWSDTAGVRAKINEELAELSAAECSGNQGKIHEEFGDLLFALVNLGRHLEVDCEQALADSTRKFETRFRRVEQSTEQDLRELPLEALEALWQQAKKDLASAAAGSADSAAASRS